MKWILIWLVLFQANQEGGVTTTTQEFDNFQACEYARTIIETEFINEVPNGGFPIVHNLACVPKALPVY